MELLRLPQPMRHVVGEWAPVKARLLAFAGLRPQPDVRAPELFDQVVVVAAVVVVSE